MLGSVSQADFGLAATALGTVKVLHDVTGHQVGPISGYQYTQAGCHHMDETRKLLLEKRGVTPDEYVIPASDRHVFHTRHQDLVPEMDRLERETRSYVGSMKNWNSGRVFYRDATDLHLMTKVSSGSSINEFGKAQAQAELTRSARAQEAYGRTSQPIPIPVNAYNSSSTRSSHGSSKRKPQREGDGSYNEEGDNASIYYSCDEGGSFSVGSSHQSHSRSSRAALHPANQAIQGQHQYPQPHLGYAQAQANQYAPHPGSSANMQPYPPSQGGYPPIAPGPRGY